MTPPFGLTDVQLVEEREGRPELISMFGGGNLPLVAQPLHHTSRFRGLPEEDDDSFDGPDMVGDPASIKGTTRSVDVCNYEVVAHEV